MKRRNLIAVLCVAAAVCMSVLIPGSVEAETTTFTGNLALGKRVTASSEYGSWVASNAVDGVQNDDTLRWQSGENVSVWSDVWFQVDLKGTSTLQSIMIQFDRKMCGNFIIQTSADGTEDGSWTDIETVSVEPFGQDKLFTQNFDTPLSAERYVRLYFTEGNPGAANKSIAIRELELIGTQEISAETMNPETAQEALSLVTELSLDESGTQIVFPDGGDYEISLKGSDWKQVVSNDAVVTDYNFYDYDVDVIVQAVHKEDAEDCAEKSMVIHVDNKRADHPELFPAVENPNEEPKIIPSIQEWYGYTGQFVLNADTRIAVNDTHQLNLMQAAENLQKDLEEFTGWKPAIIEGAGGAGDIELCSLASDIYDVGEEGYLLLNNENGLKIYSHTYTGVFYGTMSVEQVFYQQRFDGEYSFPKGVIRDFPKFEIRGVMLDIARAPYRIERLSDYAKAFSFYKINEFHVHLSDNMHQGDKTNWETAKTVEAQFRLESDTFPSLAPDAKDSEYYNTSEAFGGTPQYTKEEYIAFQEYAETLGVNVMSEIDSPGHSLSFNKYVENYPEEAAAAGVNGSTRRIGSSENGELLALEGENYENSSVFIRTLFDEYLGIDENGEYKEELAVFVGDRVQIGADEYWNISNTERTNMVQYIQDISEKVEETGKTARVWSEFLNYTDPIMDDSSEMNHIEIDMWAAGSHENVAKRISEGFKLVNLDEAYLYGNPARDRRDIVNVEYLFESWTPHIMNGYTVKKGEPALLGAKTALWADVNRMGVTERDINERAMRAASVLAEKTWGGTDEEQDFTEFSFKYSRLENGPGVAVASDIESKTDLVADYDFANMSEGTLYDVSGNEYHAAVTGGSIVEEDGTTWLTLDGAASLTTPIDSLDYPYTIQFSMKAANAENTENAILFDGYDGRLSINENGRLVTDRSFFNEEFDYTVAADTKIDVTLVGTQQVTKLYVNGVFVDALIRTSSAEEDYENVMGTFVFPLETIGEGFHGKLADIKVYKKAMSAEEVKADYEDEAAEKVNVSQNKGVAGEGRVSGGHDNADQKLHVAWKAIDGDGNTLSGTHEANESDKDSYFYGRHEDSFIALDLYQTYEVSEINLQFDKAPSSYTLWKSADGENWTQIGSTYTNTTVKFNKPVETQYLKLAGNDFQLREIEVFETVDKSGLAATVEAAAEIVEANGLSYSDKKDQADLFDAYKAAESLNENRFALQADVNAAKAALEAFVGEVVPEDPDIEDPEKTYAIYPIPQSIAYKSGEFTLSHVGIVAEEGVDQYTLAYVKEVLEENGITYTMANEISEDQDQILLGIRDSGNMVDAYAHEINIKDKDLFEQNDAYLLKADNGKIVILGKDTDSVYYGVATLKMMGSSFEDNSFVNVQIEDYATVAIRGYIEGFYGAWNFEERENLMRFARDYKMNSYVYAAKGDDYHTGKWAELYPADTLAELENLVDVGKETKVEFAWSIHLGSFFGSFSTTSDSNFESQYKKLTDKLDQLIGIGVTRIDVLNDDFGGGSHTVVVEVLNMINAYLKGKGCEPLTYCPQGYNKSWSGDGAELEALKLLDEDIRIYWTGDDVNAPITQSTVDFVTERTEHAPDYWLNYPVNEHAKSGVFLGDITYYARDGVTGLAGFHSNPSRYAYSNEVGLYQLAALVWNNNEYSAHAQEIWESAFDYLQPEVKDAYFKIASNVSNAPNSTRVPGFNESEYLKDELEALEAVLLVGGAIKDNEEALALIEEFQAILDAVVEFRANCANQDLVEELDAWLKSLTDVATAAKSALESIIAAENGDQTTAEEKLEAANAAYASMYTYKPSEDLTTTYAKAGSKRLAPFAAAAIDAAVVAVDPSAAVTKLYAKIGGQVKTADENSKRIYDGNAETYGGWNVDQKAGDYYGLNFGKVIAISEITILQGQTETHHDIFHDAVLQYSEDGVQWIDIDSVVDGNTVSATGLDIRARLVRYYLNTTGTSGKSDYWTYVREFIVVSDDLVEEEPQGIRNLAPGKTVAVSGTSDGDKNNVNDGSTDTKWDSQFIKSGNGSSAEDIGDAWVSIDLGADKEYEINQIVVKFFNKIYPTSWVIQTSDDGEAWTDVTEEMTKADDGPTHPTETVDFDTPFTGRYVRLYFNTVNTAAAGHGIGVKEFEIYGQEKQEIQPPTESDDGITYLSELNWISASENTKKDTDASGNPIEVQISGQPTVYAKGLGTVAPSEIEYVIDGSEYGIFEAYAGAVGNITNFVVKIDGEVVAESGAVNITKNAYHFEVVIPEDAETLTLLVEGDAGVEANWADVKFYERESDATDPETPAEGYSVSVSEDTSVNVGEDAQVALNVSSQEATYNTYHYVLTYDPDVLTYKSASGNAVVSDAHGTLTVLGYGEDKAVTEAVVLTFTGKAPDGGNVTLIQANIDKAENANAQDAPTAAIVNSSVNISVNGYTVILSDDFTGAGAVNHGEDYTFTAKDRYYTYTFAAEMNGVEADVVSNGDGTFTIPNVTGNLVITAEKTPMRFEVTVSGNGASDVILSSDTAVYMTQYTFQIDEKAGYNYQVSVEVGGESYHPTIDSDGETYRIAGADIRGALVITVTKAEASAETTQITFTGNGSSDVVGDNPAIADNEQNFTFTIDKDERYDYTVELVSPSQVLEADRNGVYTINSRYLNGTALTVRITKTPNEEKIVEAFEYVKLDDGKSIFLITAAGTTAEGNVFAYDGNVMSYSEGYGAYAYLVISDRTLPEVLEQAEAMISELAADQVTISYDGDVNATGRTDVNDAQLTYNMYNAYYSDFTKASMDKFLRADMNHDKTLTVLDSAAIIGILTS